MVDHDHVLPKTGSGVSGEESEASELLATYRPDYFVSGHDHAFPYTTGQGWSQKLGESRLLVPGQLLIERAISELQQAGRRIRRTLLVHCQRDMDTEGRAL
jgi:hypothetical protein